MKLKPEELEFLSAWSKEEKAPDPYSLPAHQLQAAHKVKGLLLSGLLRAGRELKVARTKKSLVFMTIPDHIGRGPRKKK
jgi:hypothetical protein